ncbi:MAG: SGNH/GDSL hydrolase family protein [Ekhidna sp.]|nr:SGNH/GDSL hydrolase family protein [Ekhidna sp.]
MVEVMTQRGKLIFINGLILFIGCAVLELIFGGWFNEDNRLNGLNLIRNKTYIYTSDLYTETPIEIKYSRDKYGLRGNSILNTPEKIDILTIGGSTTDQRYITDGKTWQDVLENCFKKEGREVLVANAGVDGQSTFGHIKNFEIWFPKIPNLNTKYILFYIGINDFYLIENERVFDNLGYNNLRKIKDNSVFYNLLRTIKGIWTANRRKLGHQKIDFTDYKYTNEDITPNELYSLYKNNLKGFEGRLSILLNHAKRLNAEPIFITQPSLKFKLNEEGNLTGVTNINYIYDYPYNGFDYYHLLSMLNESIKKIAGSETLVVELTPKFIWEEEDFYDFVHNTPQGAEKLGKEIYRQIKNKVDF